MSSYGEALAGIRSFIGELEGRSDRLSSSFREGIESVREKLSGENFHLVVMGQFKRGKSTLVNAMLGEEILPVSVIPLTSINTLIRYGEPGLRVIFDDGSVKEAPLEEISRFVTERENPGNRLGVARVDVFFPAEFLRDGLCIVDTPGVGSTFLHNDEMAYSYLSHADAVIFTISADPPISRSELDYLAEIKEYVRKIFFVQTKIDYLQPRELEESLDFNREVLSQAMGGEVEIHPLSARLALQAKESGNGDMLENSGLSAFLSRLQGFLMEEKGRILVESALTAVRRLLEEEKAGLKLERKMLSQPVELLQRKSEDFAREMEEIKRERQETLYLLEGEFKNMVSEVLDQDVERFKTERIPRVEEEFLHFVEAHEGLSSSEMEKVLGDFVRELIVRTFGDWRVEEERRLEEVFHGVEGRFLSRAQAMANRVLDIAGEIFELDLPTIRLEVELAKEGEFWFKLGEQATDLEIFVGALIRMLPRSISRRFVKRKWERELMVLFDRHCGRVRYDFYLRIQKSFNLLRLRVIEVVEKTMETVLSAVRRATEERDRSEERVRDRISQLDEDTSYLEAMVGRLEELEAKYLGGPRGAKTAAPGSSSRESSR
jgi:hypothetical protein